MQNPVSIPVLCYHHISTDNNSTFSRSSYAVTKKQFELQMNYLKDNGYKTITLNTLIDFIRNKPVELPEKPVVITFDDGLKSQLHTAYPILKKHGLDRKSTRLNSSHDQISYAVFCLKKKTKSDHHDCRPSHV